ncbi:MAG: DUF2155 domain-containing protein [Rhodospirillales bacterium]
MRPASRWRFGCAFRRRLALLALVLSAAPPLPQLAADTYPFVVLRTLDKVTARVSTIYAPVGGTVRFGALDITVDVCDKRPPEEPPESAAFLQIVERRSEQAEIGVFQGWMFASSPGLSPLQHPVYDLWVLDCVASAPNAPASSSAGGSQ